MARLTRLALVVLALALAAPASAGPRDPKERHTKAGEAIASRAVLHLSDFELGWKRASHPGHMIRCRGYNPDLSGLTRTGRARSEFSFSNRAVVQSFVSVYLDAGQAVAAFKAAVRPGFLTCAGEFFVQGFATSGSRARVVAKRMTPGPPFGTRNRSFQLAFSVTARGHTSRYEYELVLFQVDKAIGAVSFQGVGGPYRDGLAGAARRVASRL